MTTTRRLAAILAADVAGYSRLMAADEVGTLAALKAARREVVDPAVARHKGRIVKTTGDGMLVEFPSVVDAVTCAAEVQDAMAARAGGLSFRIGIDIGDIIIDGDDIFGDGVNVAARVEGECAPGGVSLSAAAYDQVRNKTKLSFDDLGERNLKNIDRPVRIYALRTAGSVPAAVSMPEPGKPLPLPDKPSIAVLPFQNMSGDPEQEYFADGMVEDIITALSRFKSLFVIARNSSFTYKGMAVDIKQVGRELGVRYVLEGSVRKGGNRLRITAQPIEAVSGTHLWADRFDGALDDVFDLQDQVTGRVVAAIAPRVTQVETERARRKPTESLTAYDCYLRGSALFERRTREAQEEARKLFERAVELDPGFSTPYAMIARCYSTAKLQGWTIHGSQPEAQVRNLAERVSELGDDDALALSSAGFALVWVCQDHDAAAAFVDRALAVNPNLGPAWMNRAVVSCFRGEHDAAVEQFMHARRLSPIGADYYLVQGYEALCYLLMGRNEEALQCATEAAAHHPNWLAGVAARTASYALTGNLEDARQSMQHLLTINPSLRISDVYTKWSYRRLEDRSRLAQALHLAGLPE